MTQPSPVPVEQPAANATESPHSHASRDEPTGEHLVPIGKAKVARPGKDVTILAWSIGMTWALEAAEELAKKHIFAEVIDLRTIHPLDIATIVESVKKTGRCVTVEEGWPQFGVGSEIAARIMDEAFDYLDGPVTRIAGPDVPGVPYNHALEDWFMVDPEKIEAAIRKLAAY